MARGAAADAGVDVCEVNPVATWRNQKRMYDLRGKTGKLLSFTQVNHPPKLFKKLAPYCVGIIEFDNGEKVIAQICDASIEDLSIGMPVRAVFRKLCEGGEKGIIRYGVKFRPETGPRSC